MNGTHTGRVCHVDASRGEARVVIGGVSCRVCGGVGCALKDRSVRVAVAASCPLREGDEVRLVTGAPAVARAVLRLLVLPAGVAVAVGCFFPLPWAAAAALATLGFAAARGSRRADLPRVLEVVTRDQLPSG